MTMLVREAMENGLAIELFDGHKGTIELKHEGKWIKAKKDIDNNKEYHLDMTTGKFLTHYYNNRKDRYVNIKNITQWFTQARIITYDYKFAKLVLFNKRQEAFSSYSNPARFIAGLSHKNCSNCEKWESIGVRIEEVEQILNEYNVGRQVERSRWRRQFFDRIRYAPNEIDKESLKIIQNYKDPLSIKKLNAYCSNDYSYQKHIILQKLIKYEKQEEYADLFLVEEFGWRKHGLESIISTDNHSWDKSRLLNIIEQYNIDVDRFVKYLRELKDFERTNIDWVLDNYKDYLEAELFLRGGKLRKVNKYPNNLVQMHHNRTSVLKEIRREQERLKDLEQKEKDKDIYASYKDLAWKPRKNDYCIIVPESADDIVEEGNKMNHCVGGYIGRISCEETFIVFMRRQKYEDVPFITVEIKNGKLCTALGYSNRRLTPVEKEFLEKYADKKGLEYTAYTRLTEA